MSTISIVHFAPLEFYPPIQNLLNELEKNQSESKIWVFTTGISWSLQPFKLQSKRIKLIRIGSSDAKRNAPLRYMSYVIFFCSVLFLLIWQRPRRILYFETISSWPPYIYRRFFNPDCEILIHYHEYVTPEGYENGMKLTRYFQQKEKWIYSRAVWISHTNKLRMERFKNDVFPVEIQNDQIVPNYPPQKWSVAPKHLLGLPILAVYAGALSLTTMHTEAFAKWIILQEGKVVWDIYSLNFTDDAEEFIKKLDSPWIRLRPGVSYDQLPTVLKEYDLGLILYKGHISNYVLNAPNKLFEYLACGLSVWLPAEMTGSLPYCTEGTYPEVLAIDFGSIDTLRPEAFLLASNKPWKPSNYFCESALASLVSKLTEV